MRGVKRWVALCHISLATYHLLLKGYASAIFRPLRTKRYPFRTQVPKNVLLFSVIRPGNSVISGRNVSICGRNAPIFERKASIFGRNASIFGRKDVISGPICQAAMISGPFPPISGFLAILLRSYRNGGEKIATENTMRTQRRSFGFWESHNSPVLCALCVLHVAGCTARGARNADQRGNSGT